MKDSSIAEKHRLQYNADATTSRFEYLINCSPTLGISPIRTALGKFHRLKVNSATLQSEIEKGVSINGLEKGLTTCALDKKPPRFEKYLIVFLAYFLTYLERCPSSSFIISPSSVPFSAVLVCTF